MKKMLDQINPDVQYSKARASFKECITNKDNEFLSGELNILVSEIITKNGSVSIKFSGEDKNHYIIETHLLLFGPNSEKIGYYCYLESENEVVIDDYLMFE